MVSEYKGSATQRLYTVMPIIIVVLVLAVVHKYATGVIQRTSL
jgi:hypothetical protein